eukprot:g3539.t1
MDDDQLGQDTIHFVGKNGVSAIVDRNKLVDVLKDSADIIVLNGCSSLPLADEILEASTKVSLGHGPLKAFKFARAKLFLLESEVPTELQYCGSSLMVSLNKFLEVDAKSQDYLLTTKTQQIISKDKNLHGKIRAGVPRIRRKPDERGLKCRFPTTQPRLRNIRKEEVENVVDFINSGTRVKIAGICGMTGQGKSSIAEQVVGKTLRQFRKGGIFWIDGTTSIQMAQEKFHYDLVARHCHTIDPKDARIPDTIDRMKVKIAEVLTKDWILRDHAPVLIVLDDVWDDTYAQCVVPFDSLPKGSTVLMTYQRTNVVDLLRNSSAHPFREFKVNSLKLNSAIELFSSTLTPRTEDCTKLRPLISRVVEMLDTHAKSIAIIASIALKYAQSLDTGMRWQSKMSASLKWVLGQLKERGIGALLEEKDEINFDQIHGELCKELTTEGKDPDTELPKAKESLVKDKLILFHWLTCTCKIKDGAARIASNFASRNDLVDHTFTDEEYSEMKIGARGKLKKGIAAFKEARRKNILSCVGLSVAALETMERTTLVQISIFSEP